jgi:simple sugar transport system permease protein
MERLMSTVEVRSLSAPERRRKRGIITMGSLGAFGLLIFGILPKSGQPVTYSFVLGNEWIFVKEWIVNSKTGALAFAVVSLLAVAIAVLQFRARKTIRIASGLFGATFLMSFLCWAG